MRNFLKLAGKFLTYTFGGAVAGAFLGTLCGAAGGLIMTFYNNNFLQETAPMGSYIWWAKFCAYLGAFFITPIGAIAGGVVGIIKILTRDRGSSTVRTSRELLEEKNDR